MNGNDLMNALSGLDPKYIDEAAFELHGKPESHSGSRKKAAVSNIRKYLFIAVPAAAAVLLTVAVFMPAITRMNKGDMASAPAPASDSAEYAPLYEAEESAEPSLSTDGLLDAYETAETESEKSSWSPETTNDAATEAVKSGWSLKQATYHEGFLILHTDGTVPTDPDELTYTIKRTDAGTTDSSDNTDGTEAIVAEGNLRSILTQTEPITLDITTLDLPAGTYTLTIADESAEFTVATE